MVPNDVRKHTLSMYNEMISYYKLNIGKISKYGRTKITKELIDNMEKRREYLTYRRSIYHG